MTIYLDNAATTFPKPEEVYLAVEHAMREIGVGSGRGSHRRGLEASRLVFDAREAVSSLFGIDDSSRVIFTHSATEALNLAINGLLEAGDHVITTTMEHNSLVRPLKAADQRGVEVTWIEAKGLGRVECGQVAGAIRNNTRLVAISHCSNVTGTIQPIEEIARFTRKAGVLLLVDAAQSAGSITLDMRSTNIDLLAAPGHKGLYGPQGTGFLYVAKGITLKPLIVGGTGGFSSSEEQPWELPERFESGTLNTPGIAGLKAGVEFVGSVGVEAIREKEATLVTHLIEGLTGLPGVVIFSPKEPGLRGGVVSFTAPGYDPADIGYRLDNEFDIAVRVGLHCAPMAHRTIGTYPHGTIRVSPGYFNTIDDIDGFLNAMGVILGH
jgi:cysteine desulfurase family protein